MTKKLSFSFPLLILALITMMLLALPACSSVVEPESSQDQPFRSLTTTEEEIASSAGHFGFDLLKEIGNVEKDKNIFISPFSVSMAFGMALNGANGETYNQIKNVLGLVGSNQEELNASYRSLLDLLVGLDKKTEFNIANSIWYREGFTVEKDFLDVNTKYFDALVSEADFGNPDVINKINDWVKQSTNSKIEKILDRIDPAVVMYVMNAIYFKGMWKYQFEKSNTTDDIFYTSNGTAACKMMKQKNNFDFYSGGTYKAVDLAYGNGSYRMMMILPDNQMAIADYTQNFSESDFLDVIKNKAEKELTLMMPRFKLEYEITLNDVLQAMGMTDAFNPGKADFTKINKGGDIFISNVKHKTFVDVNEEGTEAAAVTSIEFSRTSVDPDGIIKFDRPFMFIIYEKNSNTILFMGKIINPSA